MACRDADFSYANLRHARSRRAHGTAETAAPLLDGEEESAAEAEPKEPHEDGACLDLAATLLVVGRAEADPAVGEAGVPDVTAVDGAELGGEDDGVDEGEEDGEDVEDEEDHDGAERRDEAGDETVEADDPAEDGDEHGEVDGRRRRGGGVDVCRDDVADEGRDEQGPEQGRGPKDDADDARHDGAGIVAGWLAAPTSSPLPAQAVSVGVDDARFAAESPLIGAGSIVLADGPGWRRPGFLCPSTSSAFGADPPEPCPSPIPSPPKLSRSVPAAQRTETPNSPTPPSPIPAMSGMQNAAFDDWHITSFSQPRSYSRVSGIATTARWMDSPPTHAGPDVSCSMSDPMNPWSKNSRRPGNAMAQRTLVDATTRSVQIGSANTSAVPVLASQRPWTAAGALAHVQLADWLGPPHAVA
ncbi:hypothetical protein RJ55_04392 [Drechmeria coniospora]|nr:hypothetical protein RJ55_04392 [Drechmeria coniospora]